MKKEMVKRFLKPSVYKVLGSIAGVALAGFIAITALADTPGTVTGDRVNVRSEANTTSTVLTKVTANESVTIIEETNGSDGNKWYKIKTSSGTTGFVRSDYIKSGSATTTTTTTTTTTPNVTAIADKKAYIAGTDGTVNIRKSSTTNSDVVATAKAKSEITITGETTTDGYKWYQIKFTSGGNNMTGFIRSDLVTFTAPEGTAPAETTIGGQTGTDPDGGEGEVTSDEPVDDPVDEPETSSNTATTAQLQFLDPVGEPANVPASYEKVEVMMGDQVYAAWAKGNYYIVYGISGNSDAQWYIYDYKNNSFVSYDGLFDAENTKKSTGGVPLIVVIILAVVAVALLIATIILAIKLMSGGNEEYNDDYDIDYDDDGNDDDDDDDYDDYEEYDDDDDYEESNVKTKKTIFAKKAEKKAPVEDDYYDDEEDEDEYYDDEDEEEEYEKPAKAKKDKKKKSFKNKILDYFTVSDDDDDEDDEDYDEDDYDEDEYDDDDDGDTGDMSFIDL